MEVIDRHPERDGIYDQFVPARRLCIMTASLPDEMEVYREEIL